MLCLFDENRRPGSYLRRDLKGDVLYSSFRYKKIFLTFGALGGGMTRVEDDLPWEMLQAGLISQQQKDACDQRFFAAHDCFDGVLCFCDSVFNLRLHALEFHKLPDLGFHRGVTHWYGLLCFIGFSTLRYDQLPIRIPKGRKADIEAYAKACRESVNGLVNNFLRQAIGLTEDEWKKAPDTQDGDA